MTSISVLPIDKIDRYQGGGKAFGLVRLKAMGMNIPKTWVVTKYAAEDISGFLDSLPQEELYAVRSSASVEDGQEFSYAGQFESFLNVSGKTNLLDSIKKCFDSANSVNVKSYHKDSEKKQGINMYVVIQEMIEPEVSGVLFTADPVQQRHDIIKLSIVEGIGEELMAGHKGGETYTVFKKQTDLPESVLLKEDEFKTLVGLANSIEAQYGMPADLEWAIDDKGILWWLQLRPVTGLQNAHLNELDHKALFPEPVYTRGNIGEMMPGPVTPLTLSTFARAIEVGLQNFYLKIGAIKKRSEINLFIHSFYNHLFFSMDMLYESTRNVLMSKKENVDFSIVGAVVPDKEVKLEVGFFKALRNLMAMNKYINSAPKALQKLKELHNTFKLNCTNDALSSWELIDAKLETLFEAYSLHYVTSSQSGALYSAIINIYSKGKVPTREHQEQVSKLFSNIPDVESALVLEAIDKLAKILAKSENVKVGFLDANSKTSISYLSKNGPQEVVEAWTEFIKRHGHRCVREAEMFETEWRIDPTPVVEGLKAKTGLLFSGHNGKINGFKGREILFDDKGLNAIKKRIVKYLLPKARKAVARREQTKAWSIGVQYQFKLAYRCLAQLMLQEDLLTDEKQIFFLKHNEIGELIKFKDINHWRTLATERMGQYETLKSLSFPDLCFGIPVPETDTAVIEGGLTGIPVSQGLVSGKVRLVNSIDDAKLLKHDEIMVAKFTDIGWTPFYSVISGLVTEIGSPLSHGAVVAREYGLPAVVSMKGAMKNLETGMKIELDATTGSVTILKNE